MRNIPYRPYLIVILFLFSLMSLSIPFAEKMRSLVVCSVSPCWRGLSFIKEWSLDFMRVPLPGSNAQSQLSSIETEKIKQENQILRSQIETMREWLLLEDRLNEQMARFNGLKNQTVNDPVESSFFKRRSEELCAALELQIQSIPAKVIFREPSSWSSSVWVNVGEKNNLSLGKSIIAKNSPVLLGASLIGVIEYVGTYQSRVRLITDAHLVPSVRAVRGKEPNRYLVEHVDALLFALEGRGDLFSTEERGRLMGSLSDLKRTLGGQGEGRYLAKGELQGASSSSWRARNFSLRGVGFNYDFSDKEGPARDLRTGEVYDPQEKKEALSILKSGDLLVTTGLDGVFPAGLRVAIVSKVNSLKEGASSYEIEAISTAGNLDEISHVCILPPISPPAS